MRNKMSGILGKSMGKIFCVTALAVAGLAVTSQPASASLFMSLSDGSTTVTCNNAIAIGAGNCDTPALSWLVFPNLKKVEFDGLIGFFDINGSSSATINFPGDASLAQLDVANLSIKNTDTVASHTLTIDVTGFGFTFPPSPAAASPMVLRGSQSLTSTVISGGATTAQSFADGGNGLSSPNNPNAPCALVISSNGSCAESSIAWTRGPGPFSLRTLLTVTLNAGQSVNLNEATSAQALPEPTSLLLLGSGLLVAGRRLRKKVQA